MKKLFLPLVILFVSFSSFAQTKVGTVDSDLVLASLPELIKVQQDLEAYGSDLDKQFSDLVSKYQEQVKAYQSVETTATDAEKKTKQQDLAGLEQDIQKFRQNSQGLIQIKQNELMQPLYEKVGKALDEVAKEQNYTQVLTLNNGVGYFDPTYDLTQAVADKLGVPLKQ